MYQHWRNTLEWLTASGPVVILTSHASPLDPALLDKLRVKGIRTFVAFEIPLDMAKQRYANHFTVVANDLHETDDLRVLDFDGQHAFQLFHFAELGPPILHEGTSAAAGGGRAFDATDEYSAIWRPGAMLISSVPQMLTWASIMW